MNNAQTAQIIKSELKNKNISISKMLEDCSITKSLIYDLEKRNRTPSVELFERVADYLDVSIDYLVGRTDKPEINK